MLHIPVWRQSTTRLILAAVFGLSGLAVAFAQSGEPIKIGFGMALTGPLAANGKSSLLAMKIWEEDVNAKGGLLGRPVKLIYYDDQSNPSTVPGIYTKLLDVDKVEFAVSGYASTQIAPAMPVMMQKKRTIATLRRSQKKSASPTRRKGANHHRRIVAVCCPELGEFVQ